MKKLIFCSIIMLQSLSATVYAEDIGKGVLMVRYGAANTNLNYAKEDGYPDTLSGVSILCNKNIKGNTKENFDRLVQSDTTRPTTISQGGGALSTLVINDGAKVVADPLPGNPNHCLINNIKLSKIKGVWKIPLYTIP